MSKMLIVYYSWSNGNTKRIAEMLQNATGADIARIETAKPYEGSYDDVVEQGKRETEKGFRPEIKPLKYNISDYDIIAVGTPTWWYTMAPAVLSYLSSQNWEGKTIIPFMTDGGWPGHVIRDIKKICKGADSQCEMEVRFDSLGKDHLETPIADIQNWTEKVRRLCL